MAACTKTKKACATGFVGIALAAGANTAGVATTSAAACDSVGNRVTLKKTNLSHQAYDMQFQAGLN